MTLKSSNIIHFISIYGGAIILVILFLVFNLIAPNFYSISNYVLILKQITIIGILSCGQCFVIIGKGIDLSVGSAVAMIGIVTAILLTEMEMPIYITLVIATIMGIIVGVINGIAVTIIKIPPFITTLVTLGVFRGLTLLFSGGEFISQVNVKSPKFGFIGLGNIFGIPTQIFIFIIVIGICYLILHQTKFGRNIYLVGSNESSAKLLGVNINKTVFGTYIISGLSAALAAIILTSRTGSASPSVGVGFEFEAIVAAVLGGTYLLGGRGTIGAVIIGSLIIGILSNGMILMGMTFEIQSMVLGFLFIFIVGIQGYSYSRSKK